MPRPHLKHGVDRRALVLDKRPKAGKGSPEARFAGDEGKSRRKLRRFSAPERPLLPAVRAVSEVSRRRFYDQAGMRLTLLYCRGAK